LNSRKPIPFCNRGKLLLELQPGEEITLQGPQATLRELPDFLELEDRCGDTWVFRVKTLPPQKILFGRLRFRDHRESLSVEIGVKRQEEVFSDLSLTLFPEEASHLGVLQGKVRLYPGEYFLPRGGRLGGEVVLRGEDGATLLVSPGEVLRIEAKEARFYGLSFFHRGSEKGNVVVVLGGKVYFENCRFVGGVQEKLSWMGNGLVVARGAEVHLRHCVFFGNQASGMVVEKESRVMVEDSLFFRNGKEGLSIREKGFAHIHRSVFRENAWGICVLPGGGGEFRANRIEGNRFGGVILSRGTETIFQGNTIQRHPVGVVCAGGEETLKEENAFAENQKDILKED